MDELITVIGIFGLGFSIAVLILFNTFLPKFVKHQAAMDAMESSMNRQVETMNEWIKVLGPITVAKKQHLKLEESTNAKD